MKSIQGILIALFGFFVVISLVGNCGRKPNYQQRTVETRTISADQRLVDASEQFDLRVLEKLLKETADAAELEKRLNDKPLVHNLDLDENDEVDYIQVEEFGSGDDRGLSLFVELPPLDGETDPQIQEIASIQISREGERGEYQVRGNRHIYGNNHYYHSRFGVGDYLMMRWMFSDRNRYRSPYGYNRYPSHYQRWDPVPNDRYRSNVRGYTAGSSLRSRSQSTLRGATSPKANRTARNIKAPLKNPTSTQKSFQARNPSKQVRGGGFGRTTSSTRRASSTSRTTRSSPSIRRSISRRSGSFSGGGK